MALLQALTGSGFNPAHHATKPSALGLIVETTVNANYSKRFRASVLNPMQAVQRLTSAQQARDCIFRCSGAPFGGVGVAEGITPLHRGGPPFGGGFPQIYCNPGLGC